MDWSEQSGQLKVAARHERCVELQLYPGQTVRCRRCCRMHACMHSLTAHGPHSPTAQPNTPCR
jgi:hypothetical protein